MNAAAELITVAVCSIGEEGGCLPECLAALAAAGVNSPVVLRAESEIASLRNQALSTCRTPVIAFVDDDVLVDRTWMRALTNAWNNAPIDVACIGGPTTPETHPDAPRWLTKKVAEISTANTPVGRVEASSGRDDDDALPTYLGGNLSFRTEALAGVGGFWPAGGAGRLRDWFSEEHHAQRELYRVGWSSRLEGDIAARRVVGKSARFSSLMVGQARAGARRRLIGGAETQEWVNATKSALGAIVALAKLDRSLAAERVVRTAGHLGTISPTLLGGKTVMASASSTPFRHSVPTSDRSRGGGHGLNGAAIYCYHRVSDEPTPSGLAVTTSDFRDQLEHFLSRGNPAEIIDIALGRAPRDSFAITFDDGYSDNLLIALPILEQYNVPATIFVATRNVISGKHFWWDQVARLFDVDPTHARTRVIQINCGNETRSWAPLTRSQARSASSQLSAWLQTKLPEEIEDAIRQLDEWSPSQPDHSDDRPLTVKELLKLQSSRLVTIGAHTQTHANLKLCSSDRISAELSGSRHDLCDLTGEEPICMAYPFGVWDSDVNDDVASAAKNAGFSFAVLNGRGPSKTKGAGLFTIAREPVLGSGRTS